MYAPVRQNTFCKAADILADKCGCDVIARFEIDGDAVEAVSYTHLTLPTT